MKLTAITGPMWSGKTEYLRSKLRRAVWENSTKLAGVVIANEYNTRQSSRDLGNDGGFTVLTPDMPSDYFEKLAEYSNSRVATVVVDEIHLYEVFQSTMTIPCLLGGLLDAKNVKEIIIAGIYYDCYNDFRPFRIWENLLAIADKIKFFKSNRPCFSCGFPPYISLYSVPTSMSESCVGDHYENMCRQCAEKHMVKLRG